MLVFTSDLYMFQQQIETICVNFVVTDLECSKYGIDELKNIGINIGIGDFRSQYISYWNISYFAYRCISST